jgi:hypothetical protein
MHVTRISRYIQRSVLSAVSRNRGRSWNVLPAIRGHTYIKGLKLSPVYAMKAYWTRRGKAPLILNLGTRSRYVISFTPLQLYPRERTSIPI